LFLIGWPQTDKGTEGVGRIQNVGRRKKSQGDASEVESDPHSGEVVSLSLSFCSPSRTIHAFRAVELVKGKKEEEENLIDADRKRNGTKWTERYRGPERMQS
jgi:hypothetical protein